MAWKVTRNPNEPAPPAVHHPKRCMNCGHLGEPEEGRDEAHDEDVGCLVEGGSKFITDEEGNVYGACSCKQFVPAPEAEGDK